MWTTWARKDGYRQVVVQQYKIYKHQQRHYGRKIPRHKAKIPRRQGEGCLCGLMMLWISYSSTRRLGESMTNLWHIQGTTPGPKAKAVHMECLYGAMVILLYTKYYRLLFFGCIFKWLCNLGRYWMSLTLVYWCASFWTAICCSFTISTRLQVKMCPDSARWIDDL